MLPGLGTLASALGTVTGAMRDGVKFGFDYNRTLEESRLSFAKLLGSPGQAEAHLRALQRLRKEGISLEESAASSRRFQAARFDLEQIPLYISAVGDAARISGAEVDAITRALTQMASKGRVSAEEVNQQLAEQGIPAWRYLADAVAEVDKNFAKLTTDERIRKVQKMAELGQLSGMGGAQAILRGIQKDFGGFSREFAESTATGAEMQLEAAAARLAGMATGPFFERYKSLLRGLLTAANSETGEALARGAATGSNAAFNVLDEALKTGGSIGEGLFKGLGDSGFKAAGQYIQDFKAGIGAQSPATEFIPIGEMAAQGFKIGFSAEMGRGGGAMGFFQNPGGGRISPGVRAHDATIEEMAAKYGLDPNLLRAMMQQESGGRVGAVSSAGARGPMQLMPATARRFGVTDIHDPRQNIEGAAKYIRFLTDTFKGDLDKILAGYNAGEGAVMKYGGIPPYKETRNYVASIKANYARMGAGWSGGSSGSFTSDPVPVRVVGPADFSGFPGTPYSPEMARLAQGSNNPATTSSKDLTGGVGRMAGPGNQRAFLEWLYASQRNTVYGDNVSVRGQADYAHQVSLMAEQLNVTRNFVRLAQDHVAKLLEAQTKTFGGFSAPSGSSGITGSVKGLDGAIQQTEIDVTKLTRLFLQPLIPFPGAIEAVDALNQRIEQTVPILQKVNAEASFLGITSKDAAGAFEDAYTSAFTNVDVGAAQMFRNLPLYFVQSLNSMFQQWAASQLSGVLKQLIGWGVGALAGGVTGGLSSGSQSSNAMFGGPGGGLTTGGSFMGPPAMRFATGGSFMVGGQGGTDKTPVSFWATKGEEVTVTPPGKRAGATIVNNNVTNIIYSPRVTPNSYQSRRSSREGFEMLLGLAR